MIDGLIRDMVKIKAGLVEMSTSGEDTPSAILEQVFEA
jgi:hypothetical protein